MGNAYDFKCPMCHFETTCSKGIDRGFRIQVEPMYCTKCKVLQWTDVNLVPRLKRVFISYHWIMMGWLWMIFGTWVCGAGGR